MINYKCSLAEKSAIKYEGQSISEQDSLNSSTNFTFHYGRPDLAHIVDEAAVEANGGVVIICCGPKMLNNAVRLLVVENMDKRSKQVNVYLESYNW